MSKALKDLENGLPFALRVAVSGYVASVADATTAIYRDVGPPADEVERDTFLYFCGVWRVWTMVDGQHWILQDATRLAARQGVGAFRVGSTTVSQNSPDAQELKNLRNGLRKTIRDQGAEFLLTARGPTDVLRGLAATGLQGQ